MNTDILIKVGAGAVCGGIVGVLAGKAWDKHKAGGETEKEVAYIPRERLDLSEEKLKILENDMVEKVTANVKDAFTLYSDDVTKVSEDGMYRWMKQHSIEVPHELIWYIEDEVMGELLDDQFAGECLVESDWEDILAAWTEELRLTPSVTSACYIFDGEAFRVSLGMGSFAEAYERVNVPNTPIYPEE